MELSYDEIRRLYRLERNTSKLVEVDEDFFNSLNEFIASEKKDYLQSLKEMNLSSTSSYANLKKMIEEIFSLREKKLLNKALVSSRTNESDEAHMALQEKEVYRQMLKLLQKHHLLLSQVFADGKLESKPAKKKNGLEVVSVKLLKNVDSFIGPNMKEFGPFKKDQKTRLPLKVARLLVVRELGELEE